MADHSTRGLLPAPGSYELQHIMRAGDGSVLDTEGISHKLTEFTGAKVTLLSFIYSTCADPQGCPYVYAVFHGLRERLAREPKARNRVRLVSLSFDPMRDTPEMLRLYAGEHSSPDHPVEWCFLTTAGPRDLVPILDDFGQDVFLEVDPVTKAHLGTYSHVVKVFLIDARHWVREIYTTTYLNPDMVYNDVITLLMEDGWR
ncbi:SCO family protein [Sulfuricystis thermophila]|uniref:SCO family protein n=1 Tax=Sulfuricystis thermophila TaxID=2496847 RepID=UPI0015592A89|nr:SCO family protein [Sulfuricystis thermophila]